MEAVEQQIMDFTKATNFDNALSIVFKDYIRYKLYYLKNEKKIYEKKWGMVFDDFENESSNMQNGMSYETEQEYYLWEAVITELEYFKNKLQEWT